METAQRIWAIAGNTYREAIRMRLFLLLAIAGLASLTGGLVFQEFNLGTSELKFIADFGFGSMTLLGSIMTVVVTVQLIYGEIERRTILPLLAKPVGRGEFLAGKLCGTWLTICSFIGILALSLVIALWIREQQLSLEIGGPLADEERVKYGNVVTYAALQCMRLFILASFTAFFSSYASSSMFAVFMGFLVWIAGQLRTVAFERYAEADTAGSWIVKVAAIAIPDFRLFDLGASAIGTGGVGGEVVLRLALYALVYGLLYGAFASLALKKREL